MGSETRETLATRQCEEKGVRDAPEAFKAVWRVLGTDESHWEMLYLVSVKHLSPESTLYLLEVYALVPQSRFVSNIFYT